jgi:phosphoribosylformimino-5-aminoimidazole carboxamide ribotide isomerase
VLKAVGKEQQIPPLRYGTTTRKAKLVLIPSIDLMGGKIVQLVQGERLKLSFDDFDYWIERFAKYPLVQLIDLDAAMRQGDNRALIEMIARRLPCQVGGGLRTAEDGRRLLDAGARRVIYGSSLFGAEPAPEKDALEFADGALAAAPIMRRRHKLIRLEFAAELTKKLGEDALCFSVDTKNGRVAVRGWKESVDLTPEEAITWLEDYCAAFLYTHVDTEGTMEGFPMQVAATLRATTGRQLIVAGGIRERAEIDELDGMGVDAVAGMAVYSGAIEA